MPTGQHLVSHANARDEWRRASNPRHPRKPALTDFERPFTRKRSVRRKFGDQRQGVAGHRTVEIVFDDPDIVAMGDLDDRLAALKREC